jgi:hypothetical protein
MKPKKLATLLICALAVTPCAAIAGPVIKDVLTTYSSAGVPAGISIVGTGLCVGSPCAAPTVMLGGRNLSPATFTATTITANLPLSIFSW